MNRDELQDRVKQFALRTIRLVDALPSTVAAREIGRQLIRSATSVSANYRAARRARSRKEFISKIGITTEEADESAHWLELVIDAELLPRERVTPLHTEAEKLTRLFAKTRRSARRSRPAQPPPNHHSTKPPNEPPLNVHDDPDHIEIPNDETPS